MIRELVWDLGDLVRSLRKTPPRHAVYHWGGWHRSYAKYAIPAVLRVNSRLGESAAEILERLPSGLSTFLFHLDLSITRNVVPDRPRLIAELSRLGIRPLNAQLADITASTTVRLLRQAGLPHVMAAPDGDPDERLIVKSNYNYAGRSERLLSPRRRELLGLTHIPRSIRTKWDYRILPRRAVAVETWNDPSLAVQRFISNAEDRLHRFRICLDHWAVSSCVCPQPVKDFSIGAGFTEELLLRGSYDSSLPRSALRQAFSATEVLGLDFGAMDAIVDARGDCYIVDVNATPGISATRGPRIDFMRRAWAGAAEAAFA